MAAVNTELLAQLAATPLKESIPAEALQDALSRPPFVALPGSFNVRDVGAYSAGYVKPRVIFRSGMLDNIPEASWPILRSELGLSKIYDFRRADEVRVPLCNTDGIDVISCPYNDGSKDAPDFVSAVFAISNSATVDKAYADLYDVILRGHVSGYKQVFEKLKTAKEDDAVLFHCTAGKDRTGIMTALIFDLVGAPNDVIANEYALTRIGLEPHREKFLPHIIKSYGKDKSAANPDGTLSEEDIAKLTHLLGSYKEVMAAFLERLKEEYGGAEGYVKNHLGLSDDDINEIRTNLRPTA
ncbi:unnamed protein product [Clonostachys rhizophaga]|uniref:Tyrosine specific protein phosphatases domain-containing protein n=1 Tax=Clonostachys rhizophaga TaxID=160324 RepID=A0A9N9VXI5_9HYPO|nr:unnamed protein product [Clonostachys rhizophaga]